MIQTVEIDNFILVFDDNLGKITQFLINGNNILVPAPNDSIFDIYQAWGWDECYPNVGVPKNSNLRDHGNCWRRQSSTKIKKISSKEYKVNTVWDNLLERIINIKYSNQKEIILNVLINPLDNLKIHNKFESIYSAHPLFLAQQGDNLTIFSDEKEIFNKTFETPKDKYANKYFFESFENDKKIISKLSRKKFILEIEQLVKNIKYLGVWWCNDAWGDGREHRTIAIEPCTQKSDNPKPLGLNQEVFKSKIDYQIRIIL
jgi:hypothetical protein